MKRIFSALCLLLLGATAVRVTAQVNPYKDGTPGVTGYRSEVLSEVIVQEDKFTRLAEAIPAEKYVWRPAPDVRSFAEVFLHVSAANYNLYKLVGAPPPTGLCIAPRQPGARGCWPRHGSIVRGAAWLDRARRAARLDRARRGIARSCASAHNACA